MYAEVNVVSLIDLMMLLMVIFMITAPIMQGGVDLSLPRADARALESKEGVQVSVTGAGRIYLDGVALSMSEFRANFRVLANRTKIEGVYLRADQSVPYGIVVQLMSVVRGAGVTNIALVTEPEDVSR